jgi:hypothetical protein
MHNLLDKAHHVNHLANTTMFTDRHESMMKAIDKKLTDILLAGATQGSHKQKNRNAWSPTLCLAGRTLVYWKKKYKMARQKYFRWHDLSTLRSNTNITDMDHTNTNISFIKQNLYEARKQWKEIKQRSPQLRKEFLTELAKEHASKMNTTTEIALKVIIRTEESKQTYKNIKDIVGHRKEKITLNTNCCQ